MKVKVAAIQVGERVREDLGEIERLAISLERYGLIHPIIITKDYMLVAGRRRLAAAIKLGWVEIEVRYREELGAKESATIDLELELEENVRRKDLTWQEEVVAVRTFHKLKVEQEGQAVKGYAGRGWGIQDTADYLGVTHPLISRYIKLADALNEVPGLSDAKNMAHAWRELTRAEEGRVVTVLAEKVVQAEGEHKKVEGFTLLNGDCIVELQHLGDETADMVLTDPPYGKELEMRGADSAIVPLYRDDEGYVMSLIHSMVKEAYRVMKKDRVMLLFFDLPKYALVRAICEKAGFSVCAHPLIWHKLGAGNVLPNRSYYAMAYECILHCQKGTRELSMPGELINVLPYKRVPDQQKIHNTEKPVDLMRALIEHHTFPGELVLDPFAGSGSTLRAGLSIGRKVWGCELEKEYYSKALVALKGGTQVDDDLPPTYVGLEPGTSMWIRYWRAHAAGKKGEKHGGE